MQHIILGMKGEILARKYLKQKKYKILKTNYKNKIGEIDIIAKDKDCVVFVEVKTRTSEKFGRASEAVDKHKQHKIRSVATVYLMKNKLIDGQVRFDVIEVYDEQINHIQNAF
jgi:putative endonuclease